MSQSKKRATDAKAQAEEIRANASSNAKASKLRAETEIAEAKEQLEAAKA